jgi:hypothetical protein
MGAQIVAVVGNRQVGIGHGLALLNTDRWHRAGRRPAR